MERQPGLQGAMRNGAPPVLGDREALSEDVTAAVAAGARPRVLAVMAIYGYDEACRRDGTASADELLEQLAGAFCGVLQPFAKCYRGRRDELWTLINGSLQEASPLLEIAVTTLRSVGAPSDVSAAYGVACLPYDTDDPEEALMLADLSLGPSRPSRERRLSDRSRPDGSPTDEPGGRAA